MSFHLIFGQNETLQCTFTFIESEYTCLITIINPNGLNNFIRINGTHLENKTDQDVLRIYENIETRISTKNIPSIICDTFVNVQLISYDTMEIERIDDYSFRNCKNLSTLFVWSNKITQIHANAFKENINLRDLALSDNQLTTLDENVFENLHNLYRLSLMMNKITHLPKGIFRNIKNLRILALADNQISSLEVEWFEVADNLLTLLLDNNRIEELPRGVFSRLTILPTIYLSENRLKVINSDAFSVHPNLTRVYFQNNQIEAVDERFIDNVGVTFLHLVNNKCVSSLIIDDSPSRDHMRSVLRTCFENFERLTTGE